MPTERQAPVRRIGVQRRSVTGYMPDGNKYESTLERDLIELVREDPDFRICTAQPVYLDLAAAGTPGAPAIQYPPDLLIEWASPRKPWLVEVKYREQFTGHWREFRGKFRAARTMAALRGWEFVVRTEKEIRVPRLENYKFLRPFRSRKPARKLADCLVRLVTQGTATPFSAVQAAVAAGFTPEVAWPALWFLVSNKQLLVDLDLPITPKTPLFVAPTTA